MAHGNLNNFLIIRVLFVAVSICLQFVDKDKLLLNVTGSLEKGNLCSSRTRNISTG